MTSITKIDLPETLTKIGEQAFAMTGIGATSGGTLSIPKATVNIGFGAFVACPYLTTISVHEDNPMYASVDGLLFLKNEGHGLRVLMCYPAGKVATSYSVPADVAAVPAAFLGCQGLQSVDMSACAYMSEIHEQSFAQSQIESVTISASTTKIGNQAFGECSKLATLTFAAGSTLTTIGNQAFAKTKITSLDLPESITSIGDQAFAYTSITSLEFNNSDSLSIGEQAFALCTSLNLISCQGLSVNIGDQAFAGCTSLAYVVLPAEFVLGSAPFYGCVVLGNLSAAEMSAASVPLSNPIFCLGTAAELQASLAASSEECYGVLLADDEANPFKRLVTLKGFSMLSASTPDATQTGTASAMHDAFEAQGISLEFSYWYPDPGTGIPTLW